MMNEVGHFNESCESPGSAQPPRLRLVRAGTDRYKDEDNDAAAPGVQMPVSGVTNTRVARNGMVAVVSRSAEEARLAAMRAHPSNGSARARAHLRLITV